jgi:hypothetical protein
LNIVKIQVQKENIRKLQGLKPNSERPTSTRLKVMAYMTNMFRVVFTQGTENVITRDLSMTRETIIMLMRNTPLRGYPL